MRCLIRSLSRRIECFKGCSASSVVAAVAEHRGLKTRAALGSGGGGGYGKLESGKRERREKEKLEEIEEDGERLRSVLPPQPIFAVSSIFLQKTVVRSGGIFDRF